MEMSKKGSVLVWAGLTVSQLLFAASAQPQSVSFIERRDFEAGDGPRSVTVGDLNGDGVPDLALANVNSSDISVLLGSGNGSFQMARSVNVGGNPSSVAVGDLNGDGMLDLIVASFPTWRCSWATEMELSKMPAGLTWGMPPFPSR